MHICAECDASVDEEVKACHNWKHALLSNVYVTCTACVTHTVCVYGMWSCVHDEAGADITAGDSEGQAPLHCTAMCEQQEVRGHACMCASWGRIPCAR